MNQQTERVDPRKEPMTEEEALALFEVTARDFLKLSAAGFLTKFRRGEFTPLESYPAAMEVAKVIPEALALQR